MSNIVFEPWVGSKYLEGNRFGVKILILGESHYGKPEELNSDVTIKVVKQLAQKKRHPFFSKIAKVLLNLSSINWLSDAARAEVWEHVAFYNYIQGFVGDDSRIRPTPTMWKEAAIPFHQVIQRLNPNIILVLGKALAENLTDVPDGIVTCKIKHPSTGFKYEEWNPIFQRALSVGQTKALAHAQI